MNRCVKYFVIAVALLSASPLLAQSSIPQISFVSAPDPLKLPDNVYFGEAFGVATNSKGHVFVYTRTGSVSLTTGTTRPLTRGGARLFEFDAKGAFVREIGQGLYGFVFAHTLRVDSHDNIWAVDSASNMVIEFNPEGRVVTTFGRRPEAVSVPARRPNTDPPVMPGAPVPFDGRGRGAGILGDTFDEPTDVAWDAAGNIFISDGDENSRIAKFDKDGVFIKTWGNRGKGPGQFNKPHSMAIDVKGNVYVADRENHRIQVFDNDGNFKAQYGNVGARPGVICMTPGPHQYLYVADANADDMKNTHIYKMELNGTIIGQFGETGRQLKQFNSVGAIDCRTENDLWIGESTNFRVQKLTLHPGKQD